MLKEKRSLSGIFFRFKNPETEKFENRCFEDLPEEEQDRVLVRDSGNELEWARNMAKTLAKSLRNLGDTLDLTCEQPESEND